MGLPYSSQVDMWSLGCILYELHFGDGHPLFHISDSESEKHSNLSQLERIVEVKQELPPLVMIETCPLRLDVKELFLH